MEQNKHDVEGSRKEIEDEEKKERERKLARTFLNSKRNLFVEDEDAEASLSTHRSKLDNF